MWSRWCDRILDWRVMRQLRRGVYDDPITIRRRRANGAWIED